MFTGLFLSLLTTSVRAEDVAARNGNFQNMPPTNWFPLAPPGQPAAGIQPPFIAPRPGAPADFEGVIGAKAEVMGGIVVVTPGQELVALANDFDCRPNGMDQPTWWCVIEFDSQYVRPGGVGETAFVSLINANGQVNGIVPVGVGHHRFGIEGCLIPTTVAFWIRSNVGDAAGIESQMWVDNVTCTCEEVCPPQNIIEPMTGNEFLNAIPGPEGLPLEDSAILGVGAAAIPTLPFWAMLALALGMGAVGLVFLRGRARVRAAVD